MSTIMNVLLLMASGFFFGVGFVAHHYSSSERLARDLERALRLLGASDAVVLCSLPSPSPGMVILTVCTPDQDAVRALMARTRLLDVIGVSRKRRVLVSFASLAVTR